MSKSDSNKSEKILNAARDRLKMAISAYSETREDELNDLKFYAGSPDNNWQWPQDVISTRTASQGQPINARPCLTINKLPQHVKQVTNDQRQNRPAGKVIPVNDEADVEIAEIFDGIVRHIEYISDADVAYDTACENQVTFGEGYIRILTEYCDDDSFDQDIKIARVRNSFSVYMDPTAQDPCGADMEWCLITEDMSRDVYERTYPNAAPVTSLLSMGVGDQNLNQWINENTVRIAEYYYFEHTKRQLNLYPGNQTAFNGTPADAELRQLYGQPKRTRDVDVKQVKWCKTNGYEILEETDWAGRFIPVVRVIGNEFEVEGRIYISGLIRNAKDAQRMYNYWTSQEAEMLALAPKAPFIGYGGQFEGYENQWKTANTQNWPYLEVNPDVADGNGTPLPLPQRAVPPMAQTGLIQAKMGAAEDIKGTTGQYNASLGQGSNERSGKAILARQKESDNGTYHYVDNLARAVRHVTRQIVDLIPKIYDTYRVARIIGVDGEVDTVKINPQQPEAVKKIVDEKGNVIEKIYNPNVGKYDVRVTTGPGYATKRQEALEAMAQLLQGNPELWKVAGDLFVKNMDWPGAQEMAKRFAKTIPPEIMDGQDESPELQAAQKQIEEMGQQMEQMYQMLQGVQKSMEARDLNIKEYDAETKRLKVVQEGMTPEQIQEMILQTMAQVLDMGDQVPMIPEQQMIQDMGTVEPEMTPGEMQ